MARNTAGVVWRITTGPARPPPTPDVNIVRKYALRAARCALCAVIGSLVVSTPKQQGRWAQALDRG